MRGGTGIDTLPTSHTGMALRTQTRALTRYTRAGMRTVRAERANCICRTVRRSSSDHKSAARNSGTDAWVAQDGLPCMRRRTAEPNTHSRRSPRKHALKRLQLTLGRGRGGRTACDSRRALLFIARGRRGSQRRQLPSQLLAAHLPRAAGRLGPSRSGFCSLWSTHASASRVRRLREETFCMMIRRIVQSGSVGQSSPVGAFLLEAFVAAF